MQCGDKRAMGAAELVNPRRDRRAASVPQPEKISVTATLRCAFQIQ
jgi:hypothetical protein